MSTKQYWPKSIGINACRSTCLVLKGEAVAPKAKQSQLRQPSNKGARKKATKGGMSDEAEQRSPLSSKSAGPRLSGKRTRQLRRLKPLWSSAQQSNPLSTHAKGPEAIDLRAFRLRRLPRSEQ